MTNETSPKKLTLKVGEWEYAAESGHPEVATVSGGTVCTIAKGVTRITATATDGSGASDSCLIIVTDSTLVQSVTVEPSVLEMEIGEWKFLVATVYPSNAAKPSVCWSSSNSHIVTVNPDTSYSYLQAVLPFSKISIM